jgi:hypothetical protein
MRKWFLQLLFSFFINKASILNFSLGGRPINRDRNIDFQMGPTRSAA